MKRIAKYLLIISVFLFLTACGVPDVLLINTVYKDGSVTRKIVMTWDKPDFDLEHARVPVDSSWTIDRSYNLTENNDTIYTLSAEKTFASVKEINDDYIIHGGSNGKMDRWAEFEKSFKWFTTEYRYSENIAKAIDGYPPSDFMSEKELNLFYMPDKLRDDLKNSDDSLLYKEKFGRLDDIEEVWLGKSIVRAAFGEIDKIIDDYPESTITREQLWAQEELLASLVDSLDIDKLIDAVFGPGIMEQNEPMIDTALSIVEEQFMVSLETADYLVQTCMPGELTQTNGYIDSDGNIVWKVNGSVFLTEDYSMWAESVETNWWAWIISGLFIAFVIIGFIRRKG